MKKLLLGLMVLLHISSSVFASNKIKTAEIRTQIFCDHCKQCETCSKRIEEALYNQKGIKRVDIDDSKMIIKVAYNVNNITLDDIKQTIAENGYDADNIQATNEAKAQLDDCCKDSNKR